MGVLETYGIMALIVLGFMTILWIVSLILRNSSIVDIFWGAGFVLVNWVGFAITPAGFLPRKVLLAIIVTIWGLRLTLYILSRNLGKPEDFRYQKWRQAAPERWWWKSYFQVFLLQGALMWFISAPLTAVHLSATPARLTVLDFLGAALWAIGFFFEATGDFQLARFRANPANKGKLLNQGVWRYTRHPNYFGDATEWWGFYLIAVATGLGAVTILSPVVMTILLVRVSGVGLLEKTLKDTKPGYKEYMETTSAFIPWIPRTRGGK